MGKLWPSLISAEKRRTIDFMHFNRCRLCTVMFLKTSEISCEKCLKKGQNVRLRHFATNMRKCVLKVVRAKQRTRIPRFQIIKKLLDPSLNLAALMSMILNFGYLP